LCRSVRTAFATAKAKEVPEALYNGRSFEAKEHQEIDVDQDDV